MSKEKSVLLKLSQSGMVLALFCLLAAPGGKDAHEKDPVTIHAGHQATGFTKDEINNLLVCYKSRLEAAATGKEKYDVVFKQFPEENLYKLFIDKKRLVKSEEEKQSGKPPHLIFDEREPGYYNAMYNALKSLPDYIDSKRPITMEVLTRLHSLAIKDVRNVAEGIAGNTSYGLGNAIEQEALVELFDSEILFDPRIALRALSGVYLSDQAAEIFKNITKWRFPSRHNIYGRIEVGGGSEDLIENKFARHYYSQIEKVTSLNDKLSVIAEFIRALEVTHYFADGNTRTNVFLLLNKLLIENGIPPVILEEPNMMIGYLKLSTMVENLKVGITNFLNENAAANRRLLNSCQEERGVHDSYFDPRPSEHRIFLHSERSKWVEKAKRQLQADIDSAIAKQTPDEADESRYKPMAKAIVLGSLENVNRLLAAGAYPYGWNRKQPQYSGSYVETAHRYNNIRIFMHLMNLAKEGEIDQNFIKDAIEEEVDRGLSRTSLSPDTSIMEFLLKKATPSTLKSMAPRLNNWAQMEVFSGGLEELREARKSLVDQQFLRLSLQDSIL